MVAATTDEAKVKAIYRVVFGREPRPEELQMGLEFVQGGAIPASEQVKLNPWQQYCQLLLGTNEFLFVD